MRKKKWLLISGLLVCMGVMMACSPFSTEDDGSDIIVQKASYQNYNTGFSYVEKVEIPPTQVDASYKDIELENSEDYDVTYESVKATGSYEDICTMGVNNDILYPGALVDTLNGAYRPITIERGPITISANLESVSSASSLSSHIENPTLSSVRNGIRNIVNNNISKENALPLNLTYEIREINSQDEFAMNLGFGLQVNKLAISENFSLSNVKKQTNLALILKQIYYTVDMDAPQKYNSRDLFAESLSSSDINKSLEGTVPAYVSSVSYGRIAIISIHSNYSKQEIENALNVSWGKMSSNPGGTATKKLGVEFDNTLKNIAEDKDTTIDCYIYGGATSQSLPIFMDSESLSNIFNSFDCGGEGALPISYTMRHLDGTLAKVQSYDEYVIKNVTYKPKKLMDWSYLDDLKKSGVLLKETELKLDFSAMVDYANPNNTSLNANRTIVIPNNIEELYLLGPNNLEKEIEYNGLSIWLDRRANNNPITIYLDSISFNADETTGEGICIYSNSLALVTLDIRNTVKLRGKVGAAAIDCRNLYIKGDADFCVYGGDGENGNSAGANGVNGGCGIQADAVKLEMHGTLTVSGGKGGNGATGVTYDRTSNEKGYASDGRNGGNGGNGGSGGASINVKKLTIEKDLSLRLKLCAGNGGNGGNGGDGEFAGFDKNPTAQAGKGGNGGNGGNSGNVVENLSSLTGGAELLECKIQLGNSGNGGNGGNGGHSDESWFIGKIKWGFPGAGGDKGYAGSINGINSSWIENLERKEVINEGELGEDGIGGEGGKADYY